MKEKIIGNWLLFGDGYDPLKVTQVVKFEPDGKVFQYGAPPTEGHLGWWSVPEENIVVITYSDKTYGHTVMCLENDYTLYGENKYRSGKSHEWVLKKKT